MRIGQNSFPHRYGRRSLMIMAVNLLIACQLMACASSNSLKMEDKAASVKALETTWGIHPEALRITANGHMVDFRYRVLDPEKAVNLMHRGDDAYLIDQATGTKLPVPVTKVGQLRGTGTKPQAGRVYPVIFTSGGGIVKQGSLVTVVLGDFRAEDLIVE